MPKKTIAGIAVAGALIAASAVGTIGVLSPQKPKDTAVPTEFIVTQDYNHIPAGTHLLFDNGKYVPDHVAGYESRADFPDEFWLTEQEVAQRGYFKQI